MAYIEVSKCYSCAYCRDATLNNNQHVMACAKFNHVIEDTMEGYCFWHRRELPICDFCKQPFDTPVFLLDSETDSEISGPKKIYCGNCINKVGRK